MDICVCVPHVVFRHFYKWNCDLGIKSLNIGNFPFVWWLAQLQILMCHLWLVLLHLQLCSKKLYNKSDLDS